MPNVISINKWNLKKKKVCVCGGGGGRPPPPFIRAWFRCISNTEFSRSHAFSLSGTTLSDFLVIVNAQDLFGDEEIDDVFRPQLRQIFPEVHQNCFSCAVHLTMKHNWSIIS